MGCVERMVVDSILPHVECGSNFDFGPKVNLIFSERKGKLTKWRLTEDLKLQKVLDKDTGAILDMKFDQGMQFRWKTSIFISGPVHFLYVFCTF